MTKRLLLVSIFALGCSSAPEPAPEAASSTPGARPLTDLSVAPDPGLVVAFRARFEALAGAPACQAALVRDQPEHAHALFVSAEGEAVRAALADAFARQRRPQVAYLDSLRAQRAAPEVHARGRAALARAGVGRGADKEAALDAIDEAVTAFGEVNDPLFFAEAELLRVLVAEPSGPSEWWLDVSHARTGVQHVQASVLATGAEVVLWSPGGGSTLSRQLELEDRRARDRHTSRGLFDSAWEEALENRHWTALERLDEVLRLTPEVGPVSEGWTRSLLQVALERRQPLAALRHAATLVRDRAASVPAPDRLLLARAHQLAAQTESALAEALQTVDDAATDRDARTEASARALVAELMIDLDRHDAAADEFEAAERLFTQAGDPEGRLRQAVNRAGVLVRVRRLDDAEAALAPVRGLSLPGEEGADLSCRRDVTAALLDLLAGRASGDEAARRVEQALDIARAAGAYRAVEQYVTLPGRLRPGPG